MTILVYLFSTAVNRLLELRRPNFGLVLWITVVTGVFENPHPCHRSCQADPKSRQCYYQFVVEEYITMSKACYDCPLVTNDCERPHCIPGDGVQRSIVTVNRQLPGPFIQVCKGDEIIVMVSNQMMSMDTAIHWHGLHVREAPYMDGVPMVTQCPILPFTSFEYRFVADKSGSFIWHSHDGLQKANGVMGPIIVREVNDSQGHLYDYDLQEHVIVITDWRQTSADYQFLMHHHSNMDNKPTSILVNGKGKYKLFLDPIQNRTVHVPYQVFNVLPDKRYRFRLFSNGVLNSPVQVSIDHHSLMVIATDGFPVQPLWTDSLIVYSGERFDFVVETKQKVGNFWFRFRGLLDGDQRYYGVYQGAILRYEGASQENPSEEMTYHHTSEKNSRVLNPLNSGSTQFLLDIDVLNSTLPDDDTLRQQADFQHFIVFDFRYVDDSSFNHHDYYSVKQVKAEYRTYLPLFNYIAFMTPPFPLLTQWESVPKEIICNSTRMLHKNCSQELCSCLHILKFPLNSLVELIFVDEGATVEANHPIHLHGYHFRVVAMGRLGNKTTAEEVKRLDSQNKIVRKLQNAVIKDTVTVPSGGFTIVRLYTNNPGFWLLHCHLDFHLSTGMALVLQVGDVENFPVPPAKFPKCGNWMSD